MKAKKITLLSMLCALAMVMSYLEHFIPTPHPAVKVGLPNIIIVFVLYRIGIKEAVAVSLVRVLLTAFIFGSVGSSLPYSIAGAILSLTLMIILKQCKLFSTVVVSIVGGISHIVGQTIVSCIIMDTKEIAYLIPVLSITAVVSGTLVGIAGSLLINKVKKI